MSVSIPAPQPHSVALVTGASSGIGRALARELCDRGHDVALVARGVEQLEATAAELREAYGSTVLTMPCDVGDAAQRRQLEAQLAADGRHVSVLVLCAGFGSHRRFVEEPPERLVEMVRTNVEAVVAMSRAFAAPMVNRREGAILLVSSVVGSQPMPLITTYAATKAAVTSFGEALRTELSPYGVAVTTVAPGGVRTGFANVAGAPAANDLPDWIMSTPEFVARSALRALDRGRRIEMTRRRVRIFSVIASRLPRALWLAGCYRVLSRTAHPVPAGFPSRA